MRFVLGEQSIARLATCEPALAAVVTRAIEISPFDFTVLCGHRGQAEQDKAFAEKKSKLSWPQSKHNSLPSRAVDLAPWIDGGVNWNDPISFHVLAGVVLAAAQERGVALRWGGNWGPSWAPTLNKFPDLPHFELL